MSWIIRHCRRYLLWSSRYRQMYTSDVLHIHSTVYKHLNNNVLQRLTECVRDEAKVDRVGERRGKGCQSV